MWSEDSGAFVDDASSPWTGLGKTVCKLIRHRYEAGNGFAVLYKLHFAKQRQAIFPPKLGKHFESYEK